jgi:hypothetical protein
MRMRRRMMRAGRPLAWGQGQRTALPGRRQGEFREERVRYRLDQLAQEQARMQGWLELMQERSTSQRSRATDSAERRSSTGEAQEDQRSVFSGRIPPHGASTDEIVGDDDERLRDAVVEAFDELVDPENPAMPKVADLNAFLRERGVGPVRRKDVEPVFQEWLAERA